MKSRPTHVLGLLGGVQGQMEIAGEDAQTDRWRRGMIRDARQVTFRVQSIEDEEAMEGE